MDNSKIIKILLKAREDFESGKIDNELLKKLYLEYADVPDIEEFILSSQVLFPKLNCGLASVYLREKLKLGEVVNGKYGDESHTFLLINDNFVADITSDQYGGPKIYFGELKALGK